MWNDSMWLNSGVFPSVILFLSETCDEWSDNLLQTSRPNISANTFLCLRGLVEQPVWLCHHILQTLNECLYSLKALSIDFVPLCFYAARFQWSNTLQDANIVCFTRQLSSDSPRILQIIYLNCKTWSYYKLGVGKKWYQQDHIAVDLLNVINNLLISQSVFKMCEFPAPFHRHSK